MGTPPLDREAQIRFMQEAPARHKAILDRWMKDDDIRDMLSRRVEAPEAPEQD